MITKSRKQYKLAVNGWNSKVRRVEFWVEAETIEDAIREVELSFNIAEEFIVKCDARTVYYHKNGDVTYSN